MLFARGRLAGDDSPATPGSASHGAVDARAGELLGLQRADRGGERVGGSAAALKTPACRRCAVLEQHNVTADSLALTLRHMQHVAMHLNPTQLLLPLTSQQPSDRVPTEVSCFDR